MILHLLRARRYRDQVIRRIEQQMILHLGQDRARDAVGAFATAALNSDIGSDFLARLHKAGLTVEDAAISYFDASITAIKRVASSKRDEDLGRLIADMEHGLDRMFLEKSDRVVPRNGRAGPKMAEFTDDP